MKHQRKTILSLAIFLILLFSFTARCFPQTPDDAQKLLDEGEKLFEQLKFGEAIEKWEQGLSISEKLNDTKRICIFLDKIGITHKRLADYKKALEYLEKSLAIARKTGDRGNEETALIDIGMVYCEQGELQKSLQCELNALEITRETKIRKDEATALAAAGNACYYLSDYRKALEYYHDAVKIFHELGEKKDEATTISNMGWLYKKLGDYKSALENYSNALMLYKELGKKVSLASCLHSIGSVYRELSDSRKALECYQKALEICQETGDREGQEKNLESIGMVYFNLSDYQKALEYHQKALEISRKNGDRNYEATILQNIGVIYDTIGNDRKAMEYYEKVFEIAKNTGDRKREAELLHLMGRVYHYRKEYQKALHYYMQSCTIAHETEETDLNYMLFESIGMISEKIEDYPSAIESYQKALEYAQKTGDKQMEAGILICLGSAYISSGNCEQALAPLQQSINRSIETYNLFKMFNGLWLKAFALAKMGRDEEALFGYEYAVKLLESLRGQLKAEEFKMDFMKDKMRIYEELIELLTKKNRKEEAWNYTERAKARAFLDMLGNQKIDFREGASPELMRKEAELSDRITRMSESMEKEKDMSTRKALIQSLENLRKEYEETLQTLKISNPEYASLKSVQVASLEEIQALLDDDSLLLEYYAGERRSFLFIIDRLSIEEVELSLSQEEIRKMSIALRREILQKAACDDTIQILSDTLLPPAARNRMKGKKRLYVVPHASLHYLPFCLLKDTDGEYLVKNYQISVEPSASVWKLCLRKEKKKENAFAGFALGEVTPGSGESDSGATRSISLLSPEDVRLGFSPLPGTEDEVNAVGKWYKKPTIIIGKDMTYVRVKKEMAGKNPVHFATHGLLDPQHPSFSGLLLYDRILTMADIFSLNIDAHLVVLSACNTAVGNVSNGDELLGISRAFMYAGTPLVVASLWSVSDESTTALMMTFYRELNSGKSETRALQEAQMQLMEKYPHPFYWAPFVIIGGAQQ